MFDKGARLAELRGLADNDIKDVTKGNFRSSWDKFCSVALEYSKLLDMILNQEPEYAAITWGVIKLLLVANINHAKLKDNVEKVLISIGEKADLVSQLLFYNPTESMATVVGRLYESFVKFLEKALSYYKKSKRGRLLHLSNYVLSAEKLLLPHSEGNGCIHISVGNQI